MKTLLLALIFLTTSLFGAGRFISPITPTQSIFLDIDGAPCGEACLERLIEQKYYFSFLSKYPTTFPDSDTLQELYTNLSIAFRLDAQGNLPPIKMALLVPQKRIRGYAITTVNTIIAYLLHRSHDFQVEVFYIDNETKESVTRGMQEIAKKGYEYVVAPLTSEGAVFLPETLEEIKLFVPTVHKNLIPNPPQEAVFGGIDYEEQIEALSAHANTKVAVFSDGSMLGQNLDGFVEKFSAGPIYKQELKSSRINFKSLLTKNRRLANSSIYLNIPLVKSSLLASQLRVYEIAPHVLLSTQINYHPMLLTLSQYEDRKKLLIANSIDFVPTELRATNALMGHSIEYDWVNYATSIGIDYFYVNHFNPGSISLFKEEISKGEVHYNTKLFEAGRYRFSLME